MHNFKRHVVLLNLFPRYYIMLSLPIVSIFPNTCSHYSSFPYCYLYPPRCHTSVRFTLPTRFHVSVLYTLPSRFHNVLLTPLKHASLRLSAHSAELNYNYAQTKLPAARSRSVWNALGLSRMVTKSCHNFSKHSNLLLFRLKLQTRVMTAHDNIY